MTVTGKLAKQLSKKFGINVNFHEEEATSQFEIVAGQAREALGLPNVPPLLNLAHTAHLTLSQLTELSMTERQTLLTKEPQTKIVPLIHSRLPGVDARMINQAFSRQRPPAERAFVLFQVPFEETSSTIGSSGLDITIPGAFDKLSTLPLPGAWNGARLRSPECRSARRGGAGRGTSPGGAF